MTFPPKPMPLSLMNSTTALQKEKREARERLMGVDGGVGAGGNSLVRTTSIIANTIERALSGAGYGNIDAGVAGGGGAGGGGQRSILGDSRGGGAPTMARSASAQAPERWNGRPNLTVPDFSQTMPSAPAGGGVGGSFGAPGSASMVSPAMSAGSYRGAASASWDGRGGGGGAQLQLPPMSPFEMTHTIKDTLKKKGERQSKSRAAADHFIEKMQRRGAKQRDVESRQVRKKLMACSTAPAGLWGANQGGSRDGKTTPGERRGRRK